MGSCNRSALEALDVGEATTVDRLATIEERVFALERRMAGGSNIAGPDIQRCSLRLIVLTVFNFRISSDTGSFFCRALRAHLSAWN